MKTVTITLNQEQQESLIELMDWCVLVGRPPDISSLDTVLAAALNAQFDERGDDDAQL